MSVVDRFNCARGEHDVEVWNPPVDEYQGVLMGRCRWCRLQLSCVRKWDELVGWLDGPWEPGGLFDLEVGSVSVVNRMACAVEGHLPLGDICGRCGVHH